jgi:hypothetical protein
MFIFPLRLLRLCGAINPSCSPQSAIRIPKSEIAKRADPLIFSVFMKILAVPKIDLPDGKHL